MKNDRRYPYTFFSVETLAAAFLKLTGSKAKSKDDGFVLVTQTGLSEWRHDSLDEFYADYRKRPDMVYFMRRAKPGLQIVLSFYETETSVEVTASDRAKIESVFSIFEDAREVSRLPEPPPEPRPKPVIFIGHGRSTLWRQLKDHLHDLHGHRVEAYETGARAGHAIRDILTELVRVSSFALLVLTAEDEHADGTMHARENVIHEAGLFQGRLGYDRAIILLEEGTKEFSNIAGVQQIRFSTGNIREAFGDVLATIRREFPPS